MKKITSKTDSVISFLLKGTEPLSIDSQVGVVVSDLDAVVIEERLGSLVSIEETEEEYPTPTDNGSFLPPEPPYYPSDDGVNVETEEETTTE